MTTKTAATVSAADVEGDDDFADLCNAVLRSEHPDVTFTETEDLNRLVRGNGYSDVTSDIDYEAIICSTPEELRRRVGTRVLRSDDPTNPSWAADLDGTPATDEQIVASDAAPQGLIRIDETGAVTTQGAARVWVD